MWRAEKCVDTYELSPASMPPEPSPQRTEPATITLHAGASPLTSIAAATRALLIHSRLPSPSKWVSFPPKKPEAQ